MWISKHGPLPFNGYVITDTNLKESTYVLHTIKADYDPRNVNIPERKEELVWGIVNILDAAKDLGVTTLALPYAIIEQRGLSAKESTFTLLRTIIDWCHLQDTGALERIGIAAPLNQKSNMLIFAFEKFSKVAEQFQTVNTLMQMSSEKKDLLR